MSKICSTAWLAKYPIAARSVCVCLMLATAGCTQTIFYKATGRRLGVPAPGVELRIDLSVVQPDGQLLLIASEAATRRRKWYARLPLRANENPQAQFERGSPVRLEIDWQAWYPVEESYGCSVEPWVRAQGRELSIENGSRREAPDLAIGSTSSRAQSVLYVLGAAKPGEAGAKLEPVALVRGAFPEPGALASEDVLLFFRDSPPRPRALYLGLLPVALVRDAIVYAPAVVIFSVFIPLGVVAGVPTYGSTLPPQRQCVCREYEGGYTAEVGETSKSLDCYQSS